MLFEHSGIFAHVDRKLSTGVQNVDKSKSVVPSNRAIV